MKLRRYVKIVLLFNRHSETKGNSIPLSFRLMFNALYVRFNCNTLNCFVYFYTSIL
jgi:hypothetical protein